MESKFSTYLKEHAVFTTSELVEACGDGQTTHNLLHGAVRSGRARKVRRGLYVSASGRFEGTRPAAQLVAAKAAPDSVLCHASAYALFLGNHDVVAEAPFYTTTNARPFSFDGVRYVSYAFPKGKVETRTYRLADGSHVVGTTREQTVVDSLDAVERSGGVEATMRRLSAIRYVDGGMLVSMAEARGPSVCARLGWVLERKGAEWGVDPTVIEGLFGTLGGGPYYFGSVAARVSFDGRWRLYLPEGEQIVEGWLYG